ncbi:putative short-chain dehydrogenase/reductase family protein [Stachybotrys elegans]|uniref:Short-chain dehydrogenase/reductase family protein n=1 Tax=Stachybotrys elegans TaxID=80388 RepID=A0A8K0SGQ5_9HYPO|nr:putative short-chain dehydrogenase/reductase family protein [Stachybotrys elegans]
MAPTVPLSAKDFLRSQLLVKLPVPTKSFAGKTVIVTGSNTGMGLEGARHIARLGAAKVILAVRNLDKGKAAAESIVKTTGVSKDVVEVWELDLSDYGSVERFAARADAELARLDVVIENAGMMTQNFEYAGDDERTIKVNVFSTMLLAFLLLPKLRKTAEEFDAEVILTFTGSWMHWTTDFPEQDAPNIFEQLNKKDVARMENHERYATSKLIGLLLFRELYRNLTQPTRGRIITSLINPGGVYTDIMRDENYTLAFRLQSRLIQKLAMRTAEEGGRTLVHAAEGHHDTDGKYLADCKPARSELLSPFVQSEKGLKTQRKLWDELNAKLESVKPGVTKNV